MSEYDYCDMIEVDNDHLIMCEKEDLVKLIIDMKKERKVRSKRIEDIKKNLDGFFDTVIDDIQNKVSDLNDTIEYADDNDDWENEYENNIEEYERLFTNPNEKGVSCEVDLNED